MQDPQLMLLRTADGVLTTLEVFLNARLRLRHEVRGRMRAGALALAPTGRIVDQPARARGPTSYPADWRPRFADAYRLELQAWVDALAAGRAAAAARPPATGWSPPRSPRR